ncbi:hypothetical protein J1605_010356 [Eschrichtius robustus]|uniref:Beta-Ala-His dipeptidase n=1 Tax=Eschrichtius robustus TaxID=9764 RepID=A0AB34GUQ3_ESCRO|nr:hypothetical protein J1605_010356 [Eschrichtius robustus]
MPPERPEFTSCALRSFGHSYRQPAPRWQRPQAVKKRAPRRQEPVFGRLPPRMEHSGAPGLEGPAAVGTDLGPFLAARGGALCLFHSLCPLPAAGCRPSGGAEPVLSSTCAPGWRPGPPRSPLLVTSALRGPAEPVLASQPPVCGVRVTSGSGSEARPLTPPLGVRLARQTPREDGGHTAVLGTFWGVPLLETASLALALCAVRALSFSVLYSVQHQKLTTTQTPSEMPAVFVAGDREVSSVEAAHGISRPLSARHHLSFLAFLLLLDGGMLSPSSPPTGLLEKVFQYIDLHQDEFVQTLKEWVAVESDSVQPVLRLRRELLRMMGLAAERLRLLGARVDSVDAGFQQLPDGQSLPIPPIILAELGDDPKKPTVCFYGHLDVQPARQEDGWVTDPHTLTEVDGQ